MTRKVSFLLPFLIFAMGTGAAYSNYASEDYVDEQFADVVGYVDTQDRSIRNKMKTDNDQLFANLVLLRDMLNARDADKNWITLDTKAQLAIPAINELKAALDTKANLDDVATAESLTELNEAIAALELGKATVSDLQTLQNTVEALGDTYATDTEVSAAIAGVQSAIDNIDLSAYAKTADLAAVAMSGSYADLTGKPEIPSIAGLATEQALTNLQTALESAIAEKQNKGEYLVASDLTTLNEAITALQNGKADASTVETIQNTINGLGNTYATKADMTAADAELRAAIEAINIPSLEGYVKSSELAPVAMSGSYADLTGKPEIPSIAGLATETALNNLQATLTELINKKQDAGNYVQAGELTAMQNAIKALEDGKANLADVAAIQTTLSKLGDTYATDIELTAAINEVKALMPSLDGYAKTTDVDAVRALIPTIPTNVSAFQNDVGYITDTALTPYAKSADVEMVENKLATATAEDIAAMSSDEKATKYPSIAVSQTIANAAVTKVNEFAGDLTDLETKVETNTADIAALGETVDEVEVIAMAAIPKPGKICQAASGSCALTVDTDGNLTWAVIAGALNGN